MAFIVLFHEAGRESGLLDRAVGDKLDPEAVRRRLDVLRHLVPTEGPNKVSTRCVSISDFQVVVDTIIMVLYLEGLELECNLKVLRHFNLPDALLVWLIILWEVWGLKLSGFHVKISPAHSFVLCCETHMVRTLVVRPIGEHHPAAG